MSHKITLVFLAAIIMGTCFIPKKGFAQAKRNNQKQTDIDGTVRYTLENDISHQIKIFGRVLDENDEGVPFANVAIDTFSLGTATDFDGYFNITIYASQIPEWSCSMPLVVNIACIGYKEQCTNVSIPALNLNPQPVELDIKLELLPPGSMQINVSPYLLMDKK